MLAHINNFGNLLAYLRKEAGLTQESLSTKSNIPKASIGLFEQGRRKPSMDYVLRLADALDVNQSTRDAMLIACDYKTMAEIEVSDMAVRAVYLFATDENIMPVLAPLNIQSLVVAFLSALEVYSKAKHSQHRRLWTDTKRSASEAQRLLSQLSTRIMPYVLDSLAVANLHMGDLDETKNLIEMAMKLIGEGKEGKDHFIRGQIFTHQGDLHRDESQYEEALALYGKAKSEFSDINNELKVAWVLRKTARVYLSQGDLVMAEEILTECHDILLRHLEDVPLAEVARYEQAHVYMLMGWLYHLKGNWRLGLEYRKNTLSIAKQYRVFGRYEDHYLLMRANYHLGYDLIELGYLDEANQYLSEALILSKDLQERRQRGAILLGLARLNLERGENYWDASQEFFNKAMDDVNSTEDRLKIVRTSLYYATLDLYQGKPKEAIQKLNAARLRADHLDNWYYRGQIAYRLCQAHQKLGSYARINPIVSSISSDLEENNFYQLLARLKTLQGRVALEQGLFEEAIHLYKQALIYALRFNDHIWNEVGIEIEQSIRPGQHLNRQAAVMFCRTLAEEFMREYKYDREAKYSYNNDQEHDAGLIYQKLMEKALALEHSRVVAVFARPTYHLM